MGDNFMGFSEMSSFGRNLFANSIVIDTNILSYNYKKVKGYEWFDIYKAVIPSVVALEFLNNQSSSRHGANYYVPNIKIQQYDPGIAEFIRKRDHAFNKHRSDYLIFDFKEDIESFKIFNNYSISSVVSEKFKELYFASVKFLPKEQKKKLIKKYNYVLSQDLLCVPLVDEDIIIAYDLLDKALEDNVVNFKSNFKNSWNDILVLSKAISLSKTLWTSDKVLNNFAAEVYHARTRTVGDVLELSFGKELAEKSIVRKESKGYINRGWDYKMRK
ncbi:hypothetical protein [Hymenobacter metallilatus]|uniref:PIN domain-containing protein n=1 Tax=Hymenobacter metallilatus TaxID=2493666 RepID=A0A428JLY5_9BACT|nr:hypothetical protein [Hymenobacter metallilatus]RSK34005.1 hypothetical protein EI290_09895 [Hymenobacter metallilatus]